MKIFTCPHCHKKSISIWQKLFLGARSMSECDACGASLSVSFLSVMMCMTPVAALAIICRLDTVWKNDPNLSYVLIGLGFILCIFVAPVITKPANAEEKN